ncbi:MAG: UPF0164 family protein, partial [Melioribacteraceae bacterium]
MFKSKLDKFILLIFFSLVMIKNIPAQNVSKTGTTAANFLEIGVGANAVGMGGAFVSVANDATALYWNAGGIALLPKFEAVVVHTDWIAETNFDFAGLVLPLGDFGTLGFSFTSLSMDDMKVRTVEQPDGTGELFSAGDIAVGLSYARHLTERFSIGFTLKYIEQTIWHMSAAGIAIDAGTVFKTDLLGGITIGASISNFGTPMKLEGRDGRYFIRVDDSKLGSNERVPTSLELDSWDLPLIFQIGVSTYAVNNDIYKLLVAVDASVPNNNYQSLNAGGELSFMDFLFIRAGYNSLMLDEAEGGLS